MLPQFFRHVGLLLDYPDSRLLDTAHESILLLEGEDMEAAEQIKKFVQFVEDTPPGRLEEIYTGTFDVNPACYIYAGYLLFGEGFKRGKFMVRLKEKFREHEFPIGNELPDHVPLLFRFLTELDGDEILSHQLVEECLHPVVQKMIAALANEDGNTNPYEHVLTAIQTVFQRQTKPVHMV